MAGFKAHLGTGIINGIGFAGLGAAMNHLSPIETGTVFIFGTIGSLLPDLDSDTGKPLALLSQLVSVLVPVTAFPYLEPFVKKDIPFLICYFTLFYLFINYGVCTLIKKMTKHRGIMHSIPFAVLCGETVFLLLYPSGTVLAGYGSLAVFSGCMLHLFMDELNSMSLKFGVILVLKSSSGSALKFFSPYILSNIIIYLLVILAGIAVFSLFVTIPQSMSLT